MVLRWIVPDIYKVVLFIIISLILLFTPIIPTLSSAVVMEPQYKWEMKTPLNSFMSTQILGVSNQYFGFFTGSNALLVNVLYVLVAAYLLSCFLVYLIHRPPKLHKDNYSDHLER